MAITISGSGITSANIADGAITTDDILASDVKSLKSGRKNLIINGGFDVDQRGYSGTTSSTTNNYTVDRWTNYFATTVTKSKEVINGMNRGVLTLGSASYGDITQRIENSDNISGQTVTLSFWVKSNSGSTDLKFQFGNSIDNGLVNQNFTPTTSWQKLSYTFTVPTYSNLSNTASSYISFSSHNTSVNYSLSQVQLELGSVATDFEHRSYGEELALCQRYYERVEYVDGNIVICPMTVYGTNSSYGVFRFETTKRANPTFSASTSSTSIVLYGDGSANSSFGSADRLKTTSARLWSGESIGKSPNSSIWSELRESGSYIAFDAEL